MALTHHERIDGQGYPRGLAGDAIPIEGRITAVADVFDALTSDRVYRPAFAPEEARELMLQERGAQFDAQLLDLFFGAFDEVLTIRRDTADGSRAEPVLLPRA
jgi:putative two-component system response regulator